MLQKIVLAPSLGGTDYLKTLAGLGADPKGTFWVRYFTDIELAKYMMQCSGVICPKSFVTNLYLSARLYNDVKKIEYFSKSSFEDVFNLVKSVNELRKCIPNNESENIKKLLNVETFKRKNLAVLQYYDLLIYTLNSENIIDEIGLIRYAIDNSNPIENAEFIRYEQFEYSKLSIELLNKAAGKEVEPIKLFEDKKPVISSYTKAFGQNSEIEDILNCIYTNKYKFDECIIAAGDVNAYGKILSNYQATLKFPLIINSDQSINDTYVGRLFNSICEWNANHNHYKYLVELLNSREFNLDLFRQDIEYDEDYAIKVNTDLKLTKYEVFNFDLIIKTTGDLKLGIDDPDKNNHRLIAYDNLIQRQLSELPEDKYVQRDAIVITYVKKINEIFNKGIIHFLKRYRVEDDSNLSIERNALEKYLYLLSYGQQFSIPDKDIIRFLDKVAVGARKPAAGSLFLTSITNSISFLRKHLFIVGLDSKVFPGKVAEDPIVLDQDYKEFGVEEASTRKMKENKRLFEDLIGVATSLGIDIHLSYAYYNSETAKEQNASSVFFETYRKEKGNNKTVNDLNKEFTDKNQTVFKQVGFFDYDLFPLSVLGRKAKNTVRVQSHEVDKSTLEVEDASSLISYHGLSWSAIEKYIECPYKFFLSALLHIDQEDTKDIYTLIPANDIGHIAHELMEVCLSTSSLEEFLQLSERKIRDYFIAHPSDNPQAEKAEIEDFLEMMKNGYELEKKENSQSVLREEDIYTTHKKSQLRIHGFPDKVARLSDGTYRVVDYKTGNSVHHDVDDANSVLQGALYAYILENAKTKLNPTGTKPIRVSEFVFRYLKSNINISSSSKDHNIQEYMDVLDDWLMKIAESLKTGVFEQTGNCATCFFKSVCGGKK